jgi:hypothetical protein
MGYTVYKFSAKGLRRAPVDEFDRIILLGDNTALRYKHNVTIDFQSVPNGPYENIVVDLLIQSDVRYRGKDSHLVYAHEPVPEKLYVRSQELKHIEENKIKLPIEKFIEVIPE